MDASFECEIKSENLNDNGDIKTNNLKLNLDIQEDISKMSVIDDNVLQNNRQVIKSENMVNGTAELETFITQNIEDTINHHFNTKSKKK